MVLPATCPRGSTSCPIPRQAACGAPCPAPGASARPTSPSGSRGGGYKVLNVAGSRESRSPGIGAKVEAFMARGAPAARPLTFRGMTTSRRPKPCLAPHHFGRLPANASSTAC